VTPAPAAPDAVTTVRPGSPARAAGQVRRLGSRLVPETGLQAVIWVLVLVCVLAPVLPLVYASVQSKPIYAVGRVLRP
jgi:hypothetical protein